MAMRSARQLTAIEHGTGRLHGVAVAGLSRATRSRHATRRRCMSSRRRAPTRSSSTRDCLRSTSSRRDRRSATRSTAARPFPGSAVSRRPPSRVRSSRPAWPATDPTVPSRATRLDNGVWTGPDLAKAAEAGHRLGNPGTEGGHLDRRPAARARHRGTWPSRRSGSSGIDATQKILSNTDYWNHANDSRTGIQAGFFAWAQDYPAPSNFLTLFTCGAFLPANLNNVNLAEICNPRIDRAVSAALARQTTDPRATADATWAAVDRLVTNLAPWVPIVNPRNAVVVSRRVGNVQSNPQWGVLIDQMWVR